jgi:hypothetical protein
MGAMRYFRELGVLLVFLFFAIGTLLVHESIARPRKRQPWDLLGGALLRSLGAVVVYFLFRSWEHE